MFIVVLIIPQSLSVLESLCLSVRKSVRSLERRSVRHTRFKGSGTSRSTVRSKGNRGRNPSLFNFIQRVDDRGKVELTHSAGFCLWISIFIVFSYICVNAVKPVSSFT